MAQDEVRPFPVIVIGGSAGSLEVVLDIVRGLPANTNAVVIIVLHRKNDTESVLHDIISHITRLNVVEVEDKDAVQPGTIYIAAPDYHLLLENEYSFSLDSSEKVHYSRPSINVTFESVAGVFGKRALGILLSGANADGAEGLLVMKEAGCHTIAQDPKTAEVNYMPQQAINLKAANEIIGRAELSTAVNNFLR